MRSVVLRCRHLKRDISGLEAAVPGLLIYEGLPTPRGEDGCLEGHKAIVRESMLAGADRVWVMEDDCQFTKHFDLVRWHDDAAWAEAAGYDVLCGGSTRTYDERIVRAPADGRGAMIEVEAFHSAHCVVYFRSGFEKAMAAVQPYDLSLGRDCKMRCALVHPFVAVQRPSFSGILREQVDYVPHYRHHEQRLRLHLRMAS